jgi:uncharacterized phage protein gp47/JayE
LPFSRPTLTQIAARVRTDVQGALEGVAAFFRRSFEAGMTGAMAGASHEMHGHLAWIARQLDPSQADVDQLEALHGTPYGVYRNEARAARFTATDTGTDATVVAAGTLYQRADGVRYSVDEDVAVVAGTVTLALTALVADAASDMDDGTELLILSPIAGIDGLATVTARTLAGADKEAPAAYLARILQRRQNPPKGGAEGDFVRWSLESTIPTRAWEYPRKEGAGTVTVYAVNDLASPITISDPDLAVIAAYMDQPGRQPTTMDVFVRTPALQDVPLEINLSPNTLAVRTAVITRLKAAFSAGANPGGMTLKLSKLNEAISIATGEDDHEIVTPAANVTVPFGSLPVFDETAITWGSL